MSAPCSTKRAVLSDFSECLSEPATVKTQQRTALASLCEPSGRCYRVILKDVMVNFSLILATPGRIHHFFAGPSHNAPAAPLPRDIFSSIAAGRP